mmetsp:Transcript_39491/g.118548  ORF Transcript_39491/g.118548 Transcript_39491/m.118548 type:complete len:248 (-) Transcript_39491:233-976(-)
MGLRDLGTDLSGGDGLRHGSILRQGGFGLGARPPKGVRPVRHGPDVPNVVVRGIPAQVQGESHVHQYGIAGSGRVLAEPGTRGFYRGKPARRSRVSPRTVLSPPRDALRMDDRRGTGQPERCDLHEGIDVGADRRVGGTPIGLGRRGVGRNRHVDTIGPDVRVRHCVGAGGVRGRDEGSAGEGRGGQEEERGWKRWRIQAGSGRGAGREDAAPTLPTGGHGERDDGAVRGGEDFPRRPVERSGDIAV